jgi:hypothetical protein
VTTSATRASACRSRSPRPVRWRASNSSLPETAPADGKTPVVVKLRLLDAAGVPVQARTMLNLETSAGRWNVKDLNQDEPGVQVFVEGGQAELNCCRRPRLAMAASA